MTKKLISISFLLVFVFTLALSMSATVQQATADVCENCFAYCECKGGTSHYPGHWGGPGPFPPPGGCDVNACDSCDATPCF